MVLYRPVVLPANHPLSSGLTSDSRLLRSYRGEYVDRTPVWFMRQAGRSLPEYRELRAGGDMLAACLDPDMAAEITLQPVRRHGVDAAIFFSDIVVPVLLAGIEVRIEPGRGPVLTNPITPDDVPNLPGLDQAALDPIREAVGGAVGELGATPLIAFAGAPFTLASYLVEGGPSKDQLKIRTLAAADPETFEALLAWCARISGAFLRAQVEAGASAAQVFDSWAGSLSRGIWHHQVAGHTARTFAALDGLAVPTVHFGTGTDRILDLLPNFGASVIGVDWRLPLVDAAARVPGWPLQGNLDPAVLAAPWPVIEAAVGEVLAQGRRAPGHVFNLGHGVPPTADPGVLTRIVEFVGEASAR